MGPTKLAQGPDPVALLNLEPARVRMSAERRHIQERGVVGGEKGVGREEEQPECGEVVPPKEEHALDHMHTS